MHAFEDVPPDGNCLYRSIIQACRSVNISVPLLLKEADEDEIALKLKVHNEETEIHHDIQWLRNFVKSSLTLQPLLLHNLFDLLEECCDLAGQFPLTKGFRSNCNMTLSMRKQMFVTTCAKNVGTMNVWASEIENTVIKDKMKSIMKLNSQLIQ